MIIRQLISKAMLNQLPKIKFY